MSPEEAKQDMLRHLDRMLPNTPPLAAARPALKARVKALPPQAAPCGLVMDGDRLPLHRAQCQACAQGVQAQSYAGIDKTYGPAYMPAFTDPGAQAGISELQRALEDAYRRMATPRWYIPADAKIAPTSAPGIIEYKATPPAPVEVPKCQKRGCTRRGQGGNVDGLWLCDLDSAAYALWRSSQTGTGGVLRDAARPALLDHRPPQLAHSMGIEDPALPDA